MPWGPRTARIALRLSLQAISRDEAHEDRVAQQALVGAFLVPDLTPHPGLDPRVLAAPRGRTQARRRRTLEGCEERAHLREHPGLEAGPHAARIRAIQRRQMEAAVAAQLGTREPHDEKFTCAVDPDLQPVSRPAAGVRSVRAL